jgi:hypothetical protein
MPTRLGYSFRKLGFAILLGALSLCAVSVATALTGGVAWGESPVILRGVVHAGDAQCNHAVDPVQYTVPPGRRVEIQLSVPAGIEITGWDCASTVNLCKHAYSGTEKGLVEFLELDNGDEGSLGGAYISVTPANPTAPPPACNGALVWNPGTIDDGSDDKWECIPPCCACPCSESPDDCG